MKRIVVDARMILASGIGRHLRMVLAALDRPGVALHLLGDPAQIARAGVAGEPEVSRFTLHVYDPRSLAVLPGIVPSCDLFYSPHFATSPLPLRARERVTAIHDVYQLGSESVLPLHERLYARILFSGALGASDRVYTVSGFSRNELLRHFGSRAEGVRVVHNGVDRGLFKPGTPPPEREPYILTAGSAKPHKNLPVAIAAVRGMRRRGYRLVLAGESKGFIHGPGADWERASAGADILHAGVVADAELARLYSGALCLLMPSRYEGFGYPALEAMACGCPVVCSDIPALREVCGDAARYCDPSSPEQFSRALDELASGSGRDPDDLARMEARVRLYSRDRFDAAIRDIFGATDAAT